MSRKAEKWGQIGEVLQLFDILQSVLVHEEMLFMQLSLQIDADKNRK